MRHTRLAIGRPIATMMVFLALAVVGIISARMLPLEELPDIQFPGIFIQVPYPGSTPEEVERTITRPIEESLATLSGVEVMRSTSRDSQAEIGIRFGWDQNATAKGIEARAKIDAIRGELPPDIQRIFVFTGSLGDRPILVLRISSERDLSNAYDLLDRNLKRRIERIEGVSKVELQGVDPREVRILLDSDRLAAHQLDVRNVRDRLLRSNFAVSAGRITDSGQRFSVRPQGEFQSLDDIRSIIVGGRNLRLRDIAEVTLQTPERNYGRHLDRKYAIGLNVYKATDANMVQVADRVMAEVEKVRELKQMRGIKIFSLDNQADAVKTSLNDLLRSGLIGALLAIAVLYLFLRQLSTTLIVTLAVPFSLLITLAAMYFSGLTLNILTMMGLMLAIGMLVDNGVVVTESIFRYRLEKPDKPVEATVAGVREVGLAVIAGTLTSIIVFVPIMFGTKSNITLFLTHVAITLSVAMLASLVISQTLVPMLASRLPPPKPPKPGAFMPRLTERYARALAWAIRRRWIMFFIVIAIAGSVAVPMKFVKFEAFPQESSRRLFLPYNIEGTHPLERIESMVYRVEDFLYENAEEFNLLSVYSYFDQGRAESTLLLTDEDDATLSTKKIIERIKEGLPEIIIGEPSFVFDQQGSTEGFTVQISGDSTEVLAGVAADLTRLYATIDGLESVRSDVASGEREVRIIVDRDRAARVGLSVQEIAGSVAIAMRGENLREYRSPEGEIDVRLVFRADDKETIDDLGRLPLQSPSGERITLGSLARFHVQRGEREITRIDRATAVVIDGNLNELTMEEVKPKVEQLMDQYQLPPGYAWKFGRGFDENDRTQQIMGENIVLGVLLIFIVMAALFESTLYPISIITSILFSIVGVFWFFLLTNTTFSFMGSIGIMILIGVVVNNGIVLIDHVNNLRRGGMPRDAAIVQGGRDRLRPILMTVATTILGLLPLAVGTTQVGGGGPPYYPMARAIIGGLAFSTITSLLVVPYVYVLVDNTSRWFRRVLKLARRKRASKAVEDRA